MADAEDQYKQELKDQGVELPEAEGADDKDDKSKEPEPKAPAAAAPAEDKKEGDDTKAPDDKNDADKKDGTLQDASVVEEPQRKRSIYDDYKDKKDEAKAWKGLAVETLRARGVEVTGDETPEELQAKLTAAPAPVTKEERKEEATGLEAFAEKIGADPAVLREWQELMLKGVQPTTDPQLLERLQAFEQWQGKNAVVVEKALFEDEYAAALPAIKELLPNATEEEYGKVKARVDELSHTKDFHDKPLDYVAYRHRTELAALVSPHKKGMQGKDRKEVDVPAYDFDPNADLSTLTLVERERWQAEYEKIGRGDNNAGGLTTDAQGRKILI